MKRSIFRILIFLNLFSFCLAKEQELRPYKLVNADTLIVEKINTEYVSNLLGNVHFFYGETEFFADKADIFEKQKLVSLWGNVEVYDDTLSLFADRVNYYRKTEKLFLNGNVFAKEIHADSTYRTFEADNVRYFRNEKELHAIRNVKTYDQREDLYGKCGELNYFMNDGYGYLIKEPVIYISEEDSLSISAEKIEYFEDFKKITATFNVKTKASESEVFSDFLLYFSKEEKAIYQGNPRMISEFADAKAREFQIYFNEDEIYRIDLYDSCRVVFKTDEESEKDSWVTAQEMSFDYFEGKLKQCKAAQKVKSFFDQKKKQSKDFAQNQATGNFLVIDISDDEKIESIKMTKNIKGKYFFIKQ